jgi:hypothetical protein
MPPRGNLVNAIELLIMKSKCGLAEKSVLVSFFSSARSDAEQEPPGSHHVTKSCGNIGGKTGDTFACQQ